MCVWGGGRGGDAGEGWSKISWPKVPGSIWQYSTIRRQLVRCWPFVFLKSELLEKKNARTAAATETWLKLYHKHTHLMNGKKKANQCYYFKINRTTKTELWYLSVGPGCGGYLLRISPNSSGKDPRTRFIMPTLWHFIRTRMGIWCSMWNN